MVAFKVESWLWFSVVVVLVVCRFISRFQTRKSFFRFQIDDFLMIYLFCAYTVFIVLINICTTTRSNLIDPADIPSLTPQEIAARTYGSKIILGVEQTMCMVQWGTKACLLFLYYRLTENLVQGLFVKGVGVYVGVTFVVMEALYLGYWCRPFHDYWQTPTDNVQCTTAMHHLIVNLTFNLTSDLLIMSIPLPLMLRAHLEIKRKILLCFPFTLGFFSIICAILSKEVSFNHPFSPVWVFWYTREASTIMIVANMPYTWGLARKVFNLQSFWGGATSRSRINSGDEGYVPEMRYAGGELREIRGVEVPSESAEEPTENGEHNKKSTRWGKLSVLFSDDKTTLQSIPAITMGEGRPSSEKRSSTGGRSDDSISHKPWQSVNWSKDEEDLQLHSIPTNQSQSTPSALMPPTPALHSENERRPSNFYTRRLSNLNIRRPSTAHSIRHARPALSDVGRRSTKASVNVDAVDRLYRLDDEDLIADVEAARPRSERDGV